MIARRIRKSRFGGFQEGEFLVARVPYFRAGRELRRRVDRH